MEHHVKRNNVFFRETGVIGIFVWEFVSIWPWGIVFKLASFNTINYSDINTNRLDAVHSPRVAIDILFNMYSKTL